MVDGSVTVWAEFTLKNLNESYGHVLDFAVPEQMLLGPRPDQALAGVVINRAEDINHLISWNHRLMQPTLQFAKSHLRLHPGVILHHRYSTADKSALASLPGGPKRLAVDHVIALDDYPGPNLVVGIGRPSSKWSGRRLVSQLNDPAKELLWPLRQLANICKAAQTRYGYIQTDEEMVVCCFSEGPEGWKVAIMPVPWSRHGVDVLTTDLALWWLCMLAMSAHHHRAIVGEREMVKINDWDVVYLDEQRGWVRRHPYSNVEMPTSPPLPLDYSTRFPGNAAAGPGPHHAHDWFNIGPSAHGDLANIVNLNAANFDDLNFDGRDLYSLDMPTFPSFR